jgi:cytidylate kinase
MVITIDGPAGSGKSTAARKLAARLEIPYLDTGAMYRAIAYVALQQGVDFADHDALFEIARTIDLDLDCGPTHTRVRANGHDVSEAVRTLEVSGVTPFVARHGDIRRLLVERQRSIGSRLRAFVTEGRDQGSVVFPGADARFVLDATLQRRAERRHAEMSADGENVTFDDVLANLKARDAVDAKQWEPLLRSGDAIIIDTTHLTIPEVIEKMLSVLGRT